jgi:hypothetical protein
MVDSELKFEQVPVASEFLFLGQQFQTCREPVGSIHDFREFKAFS